MKNKIRIVIPHNLSNEEELIEINKRLTQKLLASSGRRVDHKRLGNQLDIQHLKTEITIERTGEKPIEMVICNTCGCEYQNNLFKRVFINYGGINKTIKVCSDTCQDALIDICGTGRAAKKKKDLSPVRLWN